MLPVSVDIEIITQYPRTVESTALAQAAKVFDVDESDLEVTYLSDGKATDALQSTWRFTATVTWIPKADF